jgi:hypothetical protein
MFESSEKMGVVHMQIVSPTFEKSLAILGPVISGHSCNFKLLAN